MILIKATVDLNETLVIGAGDVVKDCLIRFPPNIDEVVKLPMYPAPYVFSGCLLRPIE